MKAQAATIGDFPRTYAIHGRRTTTPQPRRPSLRVVRAAAEPAWRQSDLYDGKELRPFAGRPGAMRAFELPSLVNGVAMPRVRPALIACKDEPR